VPLTSSVSPSLGWGESRNPVGGNRTIEWTPPTGRGPINCQLTSLVPLTLTQHENGLCSSRLTQKGTFILPSSYTLIIVDDACRPALPSSALLLRPVSYLSPRSSLRSRSGLQNSFLLSRKRYARGIRARNSAALAPKHRH
jgi:hypothetical protein